MSTYNLSFYEKISNFICLLSPNAHLNNFTIIHFYRSALEQHKMSCAGIGSATCEHCGKQLVSKTSLKRHFDRYHSDHTPFDCPECYRPYRTKEALKKHMTIHGEKKYKCSVSKSRHRHTLLINFLKLNCFALMLLYLTYI